MAVSGASSSHFDLVPVDLVGTRSTILAPVRSALRVGARCLQTLLLADEINRAPAKVQRPVEVMQERQVTIAGETHRVLKLPV